MRRHFFRPFFSFADPFFTSAFHRPMRIRYYRRPQLEAQENVNTPHDIFNQFFDEHGTKTEEEKKFFQKHYPERFGPQEVQKDHYKTL